MKPSWGSSATPMQPLCLVTAVLIVILCWSTVALAAGCDASDPFLVDVINVICALTSLSSGGGGDCISHDDTCSQTTPQLFTGTTLGSPSVGTPQWCELGGRGQIMGEAAICLLRDLAQPALPPSAGGPGITISSPPISLGPLGDAQVTQRVGFLSFDVPGRMMKGYHDVSLCLPAFGCVNDETQQFSAQLIQGGAGGHCGDYPISTAWGLDWVVDEAEHTLSTTISPIIVYTPFGPISAEPQFDFGTALKLVTPPYGEPPTVQSVRAFFPPLGSGSCEAPRALLQDVLQGAVLGEGILLTQAGGAPPIDADDAGKGWDSQLALGSRDADPASPPWMLDPSQKTRPDLDQAQARKADEKEKFVGRASASLPIVYDPSKLLPDALKHSPFHVELRLSVTPAVKSSFASQFNVYLAEGSFRRPQPPPPDSCDDPHFDDTRLLFQSRVDADAAFTLTINFHFLLEINLDLPLVGSITVTLIEIDPTIVPVSISDKQPQDGPSAGATSEIMGTPETVPPPFPGYTTFTTFSAGPVDGAQFVNACLTEPPPSDQPLPQPAYIPGDPVKLVPELLYPCNICVAVDTITSVCAPKAGFPASQPCKGVNGVCVDTSGMNGCASQTVSPSLQGGKTVLFPASQAGLPAGKQWLCDEASKLGCYDLCTYDPAASTPLVVEQSAVDLSPGLKCNLLPQGADCGTAADCDDQNPCTNDLCQFQGEFKMCQHTAHDGIPCDDGLFCDGTDTCFLGACSQHAGNPCSEAGCCDESIAGCRESCAATVCGDGILQFGEQCDDGNAAGADGCSPNCTVETGFFCTGQPSSCAPLALTPTPRRTPAAQPVPVIPSAATPAGLLLISVLVWRAYRAMRSRKGPGS